jgi:K+-transporting ATPase KdpF subunit
VRKAERDEVMSFGNVALLIICGFLIAYLLYALLKAEEF